MLHTAHRLAQSRTFNAIFCRLVHTYNLDDSCPQCFDTSIERARLSAATVIGGPVCADTMSFRSRSRNVQPVIQRRSLSGSRLPNTISSYTNNRPISSTYPSSVSYSTSNYISPYTTRDSIYGSNGTRSSYYNSAGHTSRRDSYAGTSTIYKNPYTTDRYISPYTSYDNGITTASLSIKSSGYTASNGYGTKSTYTPLNGMSSVYMSKPLTRHSSSLKTASNTSLNTFSLGQSAASTASALDKSKKLSRSQSCRDPASDQKSRSLRRNSSLKSERSLSVSSEKSEGYEVRLPAAFRSLAMSPMSFDSLPLHVCLCVHGVKHQHLKPIECK